MFQRYPVVRQQDESDCGAAALATIAINYGRPIRVQELREWAGTDRRGTNLLGLVQAAERLGFTARCVRAPYEAIPNLPLPAIAHVRTDEGLGHFVVVHRVTRHRVTVADPGLGLRQLTPGQFGKQWTGHLMLVTPDPVASRNWKSVARPSAAGRFMQLLIQQRWLLGESLLAAALLSLLGLSTSYFVQYLVDSVLVREDIRLLNSLSIGMLLVALFRALFAQIHKSLLAHVSRVADLTLMSSYVRHMMLLPMSFFEARRTGDILSRLNDAAKVREAIGNTALTVVVDGMLVTVSAAVLMLYDRPLALVAIAFVPMMLVTAAAHHPFARRQARETMECAAKFSSHIVEDIAGVATVKLYAMGRSRVEAAESKLAAFTDSALLLQQLGIRMSTLGALFTGLAGIAVLWFGGQRVIAGALSVGQLMFFFTLLSYLLSPLERLALINLRIQDALVAVDRLNQVLDLDVEESGSLNRIPFRGIEHSLTLRGVSFGYGCRKKALDQVDLRIAAGSTVAVVGESGSGKTTLLKLLSQLYQPTEGQILVDGTDVRDFRLDSLRSRIGVVTQEPFVFSATIAENIAVGRSGVDREAILAAARLAGLDEFIAGLPDRYETMLGERGVNLSGGQRQRLAIARALLQDPELLIFDEATSHLDTVTERTILRNLKTAFRGKTVIVVAHRLSTIKEADKIFVLHRGRLVEQGTHRELMAVGGHYAGFWMVENGERCGKPAAWPVVVPTIEPDCPVRT